MGYSRKNPKQGGWGYGISWGIKEIACGISRGDQEKIMRNFHGSLFLALEFLRDLGSTIVLNFQRLSYALSGISRDKVNEWKIPEQFSQTFSQISHPTVLLKHVYMVSILENIEIGHFFQSRTFFISVAILTQVSSAPLMCINQSINQSIKHLFHCP